MEQPTKNILSSILSPMADASIIAFMQLNVKVMPNTIHHPSLLIAPKSIKSRRQVSSFANAKANTTQDCSPQQATTPIADQSKINRRSGNYKPPTWDFEFIQSLNSEYSGEKYLERAAELKMEVKKMLELDSVSRKPSVDQLELIDDLQRLAISYHFEVEIKKILTSIYENKYVQDHLKSISTDPDDKEKDLYSTALEFRLLRQHGFRVTQEIFHSFKDEEGNFSWRLKNDTKGLLALYEASHLPVEGENSLEARAFSAKHLKQSIINISDEYLSWLVSNALKMPLHWKISRPNARWFIEAYEKRKLDKNSTILLELAKLDYNIVQATYQKELKEVSRWWKETRLAEILSFARDRVVESYFGNAGVYFEPRHGQARIEATKLFLLLTVLDDIYDVYGTREELELFTTVVQRWDIEAIDQLPKWMQIFFLAMNNFVNKITYDVLTEQGILIVPYLRRLWRHLCESTLQEARWYSEGYIPKMEEYMENAWISITCPIILSHAHFLLENPIEKETIESVMKYHDLIRWPSIFYRLGNDLATSSDEIKRGDVATSVQCYMKETGASETEAQRHIKLMMIDAWENLNKEQTKDSPFSNAFVRSCLDFCRTVQYSYEHGDGLGIQGPEIKFRISKLLFEPI